jgi:PTS system ascorbate-specific IIA component
MIGILIVAHGALGDSLIHCASHVMGGRPQNLQQLGVTTHDDPVVILPQAREMLRQLDQGEGVLILSDIYGATPTNIICRLLEPGRVEGIAGVNLPMLVRALTYRDEPLATVVEKALSGGHDGIIHTTMEACNVATRR